MATNMNSRTSGKRIEGRWAMSKRLLNVKTSLRYCVVLLAAAILFSETCVDAAPPTDSALVLWLKADTLTGLSDNDTVTAWADSTSTGSGIGDDTSQDAALSDGGPAYETNVINGLPVVRFGGGGALSFSGSLGLSGQAAFTGFVVGTRAGSSASAQRALHFGDMDTGGPAAGLSVGLDVESAGFRFNGGNRLFSGSTFDSDFRVGAWRMTASDTFGSAEYSLDGVVATETSVGNPTGTLALQDEGYFVGRGIDTSATSTNFLTGHIAEILLYNRALSASEINAVDAYLVDKYDLRSGDFESLIENTTDGPLNNVTSRTLNGVTVTLEVDAGDPFRARTYGAFGTQAFSGTDVDTPLVPGNVSGGIDGNFISTTDQWDASSPFTFNFSEAVQGFGLTTIDVLEAGVAAGTAVTMTAWSGLNGTGTILATDTKTGPQGASGLDLDFWVSVGSNQIWSVTIGNSSGEIGAGYTGYGIDDLVLTLAGDGVVPEPAGLGLMGLALLGMRGKRS
jgi:hypothetical protein